MQSYGVIGSPLLVAWNDADRAAIPHLWRNFVREIQSSTNFVNALIVGLLNHQTLPLGELVDGPEGGYIRSAQPICDLIWRHREELLCREPLLLADALLILGRNEAPRRPPRPGTYTNALQVLRTNLFHVYIDREDCFSPELAERLFIPSEFQTNHLNALLQKIGTRDNSSTNGPVGRADFLRFLLFFRDYLYNVGRHPDRLRESSYVRPYYHEEIFHHLYHPEDYSDEEAGHVLRRLKQMRPPSGAAPPTLTRYIEELERRFAKAPESKLASIPNHLRLQSNRVTLVANKLWKAPALRSRLQSDASIAIFHAIYREKYLWLEGPRTLHTMVKTGFDEYRPENADQNVIWQVDLNTWQTKSNAFQRFKREAVEMNPPRTFEVINGKIYRVGGDKLLAKSFDEEEWHDLKVPLSGFMTPNLVGSRLYLGSAEALVEVDPTSLATRLLASKRRPQAENEGDQFIGFDKPQFTAGDQDDILIFLGDSFRIWNRASGAWAGALPQKPADRRVNYMDGNETFFATAESNNVVRRFWRLANGRAAEELFPARSVSRGFDSGPLRRKPIPSNPKWQCPETIDPPNMLLAPDGEDLWCLGVNGVGEGHLVYFDDRWADPLQFDFKVKPLFAAVCQPGGLEMLLSPKMLVTPDGLVLYRPGCLAFWFIPRADLDKAIAEAVAQNSPRPRNQNGSLPAVAAGKSTPVYSKNGVDCTATLSRFDQDQDGCLIWSELSQAIRFHGALVKLRVPAESRFSPLILIFPYDANQDRKLDPAELAALLDNPEPEQLPASLKVYDTNGDGQLDQDEVQAVRKLLKK